MGSLNANVAAVGGALTAARPYDLERIVHALEHAAVVGVHGEPEVGKTTLVAEALRRNNLDAIRVDLAAVADDHDVVAMIARGLVRWLLAAGQGENELSLATLALPDGLRPGTASRVRAQIRHEIGTTLMGMAVDAGERAASSMIGIEDALDAVSRAAQRRDIRPPVLWFDHFEAPGVTPRHPVDTEALLWTVRSQTQVTGLPVILSGSKAASSLAYGRRAAFYGDGLWVQIDRPGAAVWGAVAERSGVASASWGSRFAELTEGHPSTTLTGLVTRPALPGDPTPLDVWEHLVVLENGLSARTLQFARQTHRLGGRVLLTIAQGNGPYVGAGDPSVRKEIHKVVQKLHRAGVLTQPAPRAWSVANPVVAAQLSGLPRRADWRRTSSGDGEG
jgi:hypothetical protein